MAQKKSGGKTKNGRDSCGKRLGIKCFGGQTVNVGSILVRQRGTKIMPGQNTTLGKDHTIFSKINGFVFFKKIRHWKKHKTYVYIEKFIQ